MNPYTKTPVNAVWFAASSAFLLGLLAFAGGEAVNAVFSLGVTAQNVAARRLETSLDFFHFCEIDIIFQLLMGKSK